MKEIRRSGDVFLYPRSASNNGKRNRREDILAKPTALAVVLCESRILLRDEVMHERALVGPENVLEVECVDSALPLFSVAAYWDEGQNTDAQRRYVSRRVAADVAKWAIQEDVVGERSYDVELQIDDYGIEADRGIRRKTKRRVKIAVGAQALRTTEGSNARPSL